VYFPQDLDSSWYEYYYGYHNDYVEVIKSGEEHPCGYEQKTTAWGCTHAGDALINNFYGYETIVKNETVNIVDVNDGTFHFYLKHYFENNLGKYYEYDSEMTADLIINIAGETFGPFSHVPNYYVDTHDENGYVNPEYIGDTVVMVTCDDNCNCEMKPTTETGTDASTANVSFSTSPTPSLYTTSITDAPTRSASPTALTSATTKSKSNDHATFTCSNDADYRYSNDTKKSCAWISYKPGRRKRHCVEEEVVNACPISCGLCCEDDLTFTFVTNAGKKQHCAWIAENPEMREKNLCRSRAIRNHCTLACNICYDKERVVDELPINDDTTCEDDLSFNFTTDAGKEQNCAWIRKNPDKRKIKYCRRISIKTHCTSICASCHDHVTSPPSTPSNYPSSRPSINLTLTPSTDPALTPSASPTSTLTKDPTLLPSTFSPVLTPPVDPTPTLPPTTKTPSLSTSCTDLIYANVDEMEKGNVVIIQFDYEIERDPFVPGSLFWEILPNVEASLTNLLIQDLLPFCNENRRLRSYQAHNAIQLGKLVGVSSSPTDVSDGAAECQSNLAEGSACAVIRGGISLFVKGVSDGEAYASQSSIKNIMDNDSLLSAHNAILKVIYMSKVQTISHDDNDDIGLDADDDTEFWRTGYFKGIMLGVFSGLLTMICIRCVVRRGNVRGSLTSPSEWTEITPDSNYSHSSDSTTSSDDETVRTSNKVGSTTRAAKNDEMVVDVDIESYSRSLKKTKSSKKKDDFFDVIFDDSKMKKKKMSDETSDIST